MSETWQSVSEGKAKQPDYSFDQWLLKALSKKIEIEDLLDDSGAKEKELEAEKTKEKEPKSKDQKGEDSKKIDLKNDEKENIEDKEATPTEDENDLDKEEKESED